MMFPQYTPRELGCFNKINSKIKSTQMYKAETVFKVNTLEKMLWGLKSSARRSASRYGANSLWSNTHRLTALVVFKPGSEENGKPLNQVV